MCSLQNGKNIISKNEPKMVKSRKKSYKLCECNMQIECLKNTKSKNVNFFIVIWCGCYDRGCFSWYGDWCDWSGLFQSTFFCGTTFFSITKKKPKSMSHFSIENNQAQIIHLKSLKKRKNKSNWYNYRYRLVLMLQMLWWSKSTAIRLKMLISFCINFDRIRPQICKKNNNKLTK